MVSEAIPPTARRPDRYTDMSSRDLYGALGRLIGTAFLLLRTIRIVALNNFLEAVLDILEKTSYDSNQFIRLMDTGTETATEFMETA